jgi:hypothetical protein
VNKTGHGTAQQGGGLCHDGLHVSIQLEMQARSGDPEQRQNNDAVFSRLFGSCVQ